MKMFTKLTIKSEIVDQSYEDSSHQKIDDFFSYESNIQVSDELNIPPKKRIKVEDEIRDPRLLKHRSNSEIKPVPKVEIKPEISYKWKPDVDPKWRPEVEKRFISTFRPVVDKSSLKSRPEPSIPSYYENVLSELFQWSPEWLQGSVGDKPLLQRLEQKMRQNRFKYEYNREEYISRYLPFIERELFLKLSDKFKNEAPSRSEHTIFVNDCSNTGHMELNRQLNCYLLRDIRKCRKPLFKVNDVITISLEVVSGKTMAKKKYFGIISSHSMFEMNDLDPKVIKTYESLANNKLDKRDYDSLLWDRLTILTKRALNSSILPKVLAKIDILLNAGFELRLLQNLMDRSPKCTKLMSNIYSGCGNIHQFSAEELKDFRSVAKTLAQNANEMINKSKPNVFFKGNNNLMIVDISDNELRFKYLCDVAVDVAGRNPFGTLRILVITENDAMNTKWLDRLTKIGPRSIAKPWYVDGKRGWTRHNTVTRFVQLNAKRIYESLGSKLKAVRRRDDPKTYEELLRRKQTYKEIMDCHKSPPSAFLYQERTTTSFMIAREELVNKGLETALNDSNIIIGTFDDVLNCQQLFNDKSKPFDCCIIDDTHLLCDPFITSIIHLGINTMIIGGDSESKADLIEDQLVMDYKYNCSLFERIIKKCLNFSQKKV